MSYNALDRPGSPTIPEIKQPQSNGSGSSPIIANNDRFVEDKLDGDTGGGQVELYFRRYLFLGVFCVYSASNSFQWIEYAIIQNIVMHYYSVDELAVNWLSLVYMIAYIPLIFPATWLLEKKGIRICLIVGAFLNCAAAWIKCGSVDPSRYWVTVIGQILAAMSQLFILGIPPPLAATWFSEKDVSRACSVGVFGNQVGVALGFLIPPIIVKNSVHKSEIERGLNIMFYTIAAIASLIFLIILIFFQNAPPHPPSKAQAATLGSLEVTSYKKSMSNLIKNRSYVLLVISYGINTGIYYAISTLLNQALDMYFKGQETTFGQIGLTIVIAGLVGSVLAGLVLDKTHKFKETTLVIYALCVASMLAYTFTLQVHSIVVVFITAGSLGFFMTGYLPVGFEFAAEITYPEPEGTSSGFLNASAQFFGIILTLGGSALLVKHGDIACHVFFCAALAAGFIMTAFIRSDLKRQRAGQPIPRDDPDPNKI